MPSESKTVEKWGATPNVIGCMTTVQPVEHFGNILFVATTLEAVLLLCDTWAQASPVFARTMIAMRMMADAPIVDAAAEGIAEALGDSENNDWKHRVVAVTNAKFVWMGTDLRFPRFHTFGIKCWNTFIYRFFQTVLSDCKRTVTQFECTAQAAIEFVVDVAQPDPRAKKTLAAFAAMITGTRAGDTMAHHLDVFSRTADVATL